MKPHNNTRAVYYPPGDLAAGWCVERVSQVVSESRDLETITVNDAIEFYQCKLIVEEHRDFFDKSSLHRLNSILKRIFPLACRVIDSALRKHSIVVIYKQIESQYLSQFWDFVAATNTWRLIEPEGLENLLINQPYLLRDVLGISPLVQHFDACLYDVIKQCPEVSAELVLQAFGSQNASRRKLYLPPSANNEILDKVMLEYLSSESCNLNHVQLLANWPRAAYNTYRPSSEVLVAAKKRARTLNDELFKRGFQITQHLSVVFSGEQKACKSVKFDGLDYTLSFGTEWLITYTDPATVLNNFIYVFDFVNFEGLLMVPARKHEPKSLIERLGIHGLDEYPSTIGFSMRQSHAQLEVFAYSNLLESLDLRLEDAIAWVYNDYIRNEFGIEGFGIRLPTAATSFLDKCKSIGPEIERVVKSFQGYVERGAVDEDYFPHTTFKLFEDIPSLISNKYAVPSSDFERLTGHLFSDQSPLIYAWDVEVDDRRFYSRLLHGQMLKSDCPENCLPIVDWLIELQLITEDAGGVLELTDKAHICRRLWDDGAIALFRHTELSSSPFWYQQSAKLGTASQQAWYRE